MKLRLKNRPTIEFPSDCQRIQRALLHHRGLDISLAEAQEIWQHRSNEWSAGWLGLPAKDELLAEEIMEYVELEEDAT